MRPSRTPIAFLVALLLVAPGAAAQSNGAPPSLTGFGAFAWGTEEAAIRAHLGTPDHDTVSTTGYRVLTYRGRAYDRQAESVAYLLPGHGLVGGLLALNPESGESCRDLATRLLPRLRARYAEAHIVVSDLDLETDGRAWCRAQAGRTFASVEDKADTAYLLTLGVSKSGTQLRLLAQTALSRRLNEGRTPPPHRGATHRPISDEVGGPCAGDGCRGPEFDRLVQILRPSLLRIVRLEWDATLPVAFQLTAFEAEQFVCSRGLPRLDGMRSCAAAAADARRVAATVRTRYTPIQRGWAALADSLRRGGGADDVAPAIRGEVVALLEHRARALRGLLDALTVAATARDPLSQVVEAVDATASLEWEASALPWSWLTGRLQDSTRATPVVAPVKTIPRYVVGTAYLGPRQRGRLIGPALRLETGDFVAAGEGVVGVGQRAIYRPGDRAPARPAGFVPDKALRPTPATHTVAIPVF